MDTSSTSCDICDRHFLTNAEYQQHVKEHKVCNIDGCSFTAHTKVIEKHIQMQHSTGMYDKIRNVSTPEDITRWIEERKRKYPSRENVEQRMKQQEEMLKRGERIRSKKGRFAAKNETRRK